MMRNVLELRVCYLGRTQRCIPHPGQAQVPAAAQAHPWLDNELESETNEESSCLAHACRLCKHLWTAISGVSSEVPWELGEKCNPVQYSALTEF